MTKEIESAEESSMFNDVLTFKLHNNQLPGKDQFSKEMLKTQEVMDIVVGGLLNVPKGTYTSAETEWHNSSKSDILYKPRLAAQSSLPPVLVEVQLTVNEPFMQRVVSYAQNAMNTYKLYPIVLIFCIDRVSPAQLATKFKTSDQKPWMASLETTDFWAKSCYIVSKLTLESDSSTSQLTPLQALASFLIEGSPTLHAHSHADNDTIKQLYQIAMTVSKSQVQSDNDLSNVVDIICFNNEKLLKKAHDALFGVTGTSKAKLAIERALVFNAAAKRKYCQNLNSDSDSSLEPLPKLKGKTSEIRGNRKQDDLEFVIGYKRDLIGKMDWKKCLSIGHEKKLCQTYSTGESLRRFFYNATKK
ncbi:uncharacterized protein EV154DRAFT_507367 [Mucor mucedo]|uniref:uncharacterized protein n=1 Tax=Mucor mucedo TaxID=29922 RepID=UPI002220D7FC|nr:uncharacterized protein EV154DRAFT_507367 [Mucor mucedo]KAI7891628.1 hypothetical protein EV154DRAFT_507367 [Mucor mucedo]